MFLRLEFVSAMLVVDHQKYLIAFGVERTAARTSSHRDLIALLFQLLMEIRLSFFARSLICVSVSAEESSRSVEGGQGPEHQEEGHQQVLYRLYNSRDRLHSRLHQLCTSL